MHRPPLRRALPPALGFLVCLGMAFFLACGDRQPQSVKPAETQGVTESAGLPGMAQFADRDLLGELELGKAGDPTFESVAAYLPTLKRPREAVGVKHHPHEIGVAPDATLELSEDASAPENPQAYFEVGESAVRYGAAPGGRRAVSHGRFADLEIGLRVLWGARVLGEFQGGIGGHADLVGMVFDADRFAGPFQRRKI